MPPVLPAGMVPVPGNAPPTPPLPPADNGDATAHEVADGFKWAALGFAVLGAGLAIAGCFFPPLELGAAGAFEAASLAAGAFEAAEFSYAVGVSVDVGVAAAHPTPANQAVVVGDAITLAAGYGLGAVLRYGPAVGKAFLRPPTRGLPQTGQATEEVVAEATAARAARRQAIQTRAHQRAQALDNDGGHSYADHGAHTTKAQQATRLRTGTAPSGRTPTYAKGPKKGQAQIPSEASKFGSHEKHLEAARKAEVKLQANKMNPDGSLKKTVVVEVPVQNAGTSYHLDGNGNTLSQPVNSAKAVYRLDPATNTYKLITLYPQP